MNMIERGRCFVERLRALAKRSPYDWRQCPRCGSTWTRKNGGYYRYPWRLWGREKVRVQRHWCALCRRTYGEENPGLPWKAWYGREVQRQAVDGWVHSECTPFRAQFLAAGGGTGAFGDRAPGAHRPRVAMARLSLASQPWTQSLPFAPLNA